jgi:hypothetical protein
MLHAVKDVHAILFGVARVLVERLESQSGHVKDKDLRGCDPEALLFTVEPDTSLNICGQNKRSTTNSSG